MRACRACQQSVRLDRNCVWLPCWQTCVHAAPYIHAEAPECRDGLLMLQRCDEIGGQVATEAVIRDDYCLQSMSHLVLLHLSQATRTFTAQSAFQRPLLTCRCSRSHQNTSAALDASSHNTTRRNIEQHSTVRHTAQEGACPGTSYEQEVPKRHKVLLRRGLTRHRPVA